MSDFSFDFSDVTAAIASTLGDSVRDRKLVRLGNPILYEAGADDPVRAVFPDDAETPGQIWVHEESDSGEPTPPYTVINGGRGKLSDEELIYRMPVHLVMDGSKYITDGLGGYAAVEFMHTVNVRPQRNIDISQITYGLLRPSDPVSMKLLFTGAYPVLAATVYQLLPQLTADLSSHVPGAGLARAVMVEINPATAAFTYTAGSTFSYNHVADIPAHRDAYSSYPQTVNESRFLLGWARLYHGMTQIVQRDILAAQELMGKGASSSGTGVTVTYCGRPLWYAGKRVVYTSEG